MSLTVTSWATTNFTGTFWNNYQETMKLRDEWFNYSFNPGTLTVVDKKISNRTADNRNGALANNTTTESGVTTSADAMLVNWEYINYNTINTEGGQVPEAMARKLAYGLAHTKMIELLSYGIQQARTANRTQSFDDETTDGSSVYQGLLNIWSTLAAAGVPETDLYCALHPTYYAQLRSYAPSASRDYISSIGNEDYQNQGFTLFGMKIIPMKACFQVDTTASPYDNLASKYKFDFSAGTTNDIGFVWHKDAYRVHAIQKPTAKIVDSPENQAWLVSASEQFGTGIIDTTGIYTLRRD